jgi:outer membrane protein OmpA-like peptidoglycan-associated protein
MKVTRILSWMVSLCVLLSVCSSSHAQAITEDEEKFISNSAADFILFGDYESALSLYEQLDSLRPENSIYTFNRGLCTYHAGDRPSSLLYFLKAYKLGYRRPEIYLFLGKAYHFNFDLENAVYYFDEYLAVLPSDTSDYEFLRQEAVTLRNQILSSKEILDKKLSVDIKNLGSTINSEYAEYVPISISSDSVLVFTSRRSSSTGGKLAPDGRYYEDIYLSSRSHDGDWQAPQPFPKFNGSRHDANVAINKDGTVLYIFKARRNGDIFQSKLRTDGSWSKPRRVKGINSHYWEGSICLSPLEDTLYFSSDRPGGQGGSDIYFAVKEKTKWRKVKNLGPDINTSFDEDAPYMYKDGKTFFFSSKGHNSIGGYDVFSIKHRDGKWQELKNVGFPINSIADDIYFQLNSSASIGYFTSYRFSNFKESSIGEKDLFEIERPHSSPVYFVFKGRVYNEKTREPIPAIVTIKNLEDTTASIQRMVVDINSGKFRSDLKFENHYKITVEVNGKMYFSKELYYPYQPDLFESFLDIPLRDVPVFKMKLTDLILDRVDSTSNTILDDRKQQTIILVRKVSLEDPQLRDLLTSKTIPALFRKKILDQLKNKSFADEPDEGNFAADLVNEMRKSLPAGEPPALYAKLDMGSAPEVSNVSVRDLFKKTANGTLQDSNSYEKLSVDEKGIVDRMVEAILGNEVENSMSLDEVYHASLTPDEREKITTVIAHEVNERISSDSTLTSEQRQRASLNLYSFIDNRGPRSLDPTPLRVSDNGGWGVLYTIESSHFHHKGGDRILFNGQVLFRNSHQSAADVDLLLTDDNGLIYSRRSSNADGFVSFSDLTPGRRYHILVNDFSISLLAYSRYEMKVLEMRAKEEDYIAFYNNLTAEEKRSVDRIIASRLNESADADKKWRTAADLDKLSESDKGFIERVKKYLKASSMENADFFMDKRDAHYYEQYNSFERESLNQIIAEDIIPNRRDSIFFNKLDTHEKGFIDKLRDNRLSRKRLLDEILTSHRESDYWYILDEVKCNTGGQSGKVAISGNVLYKLRPPIQTVQVALMDENKQIITATVTDSSGYVFLVGVECDKIYHLLINTGANIGDLSNYSFSGQQAHEDIDDFLSSLSEEDSRVIRRIIAIQLAAEQYEKNDSLKSRDQRAYNLLSVEERNFIERLRRHLFSDSIANPDAHLSRFDNNVYYMLLKPEERDFINRAVVKAQFTQVVHTDVIRLSGPEKKYYDQLSPAHRDAVNKLFRQRRAEKDIFAENPVLITEKAWALLDSVNGSGVREEFEITGRLLHSGDSSVAVNVPVMINNSQYEVITIVSTDDTGKFFIKGLAPRSDYFVLAQDKRTLFSSKPSYLLQDLQVVFKKRDSLQREVLFAVIYFDFDSHRIKSAELPNLHDFLKKYNNPIDFLLIEGHTDNIGSDAYNYQLSQKRAESVKTMFIQQGLNPRLLKVKGYGESRRIYSGSRESSNRRVEIKVMQP